MSKRFGPSPSNLDPREFREPIFENAQLNAQLIFRNPLKIRSDGDQLWSTGPQFI
jgi:hypothetical protein